MPRTDRIELFITHAEGGCTCADCMTEEQKASMERDDVEVWETYSDGWLSAPVCRVCKLSMPVYCDGTEGES